MSLALVEQNVIDLLGRDHFRLACLFVENGEVEGVVFVKDGDFSMSVLADDYLGVVQGIGGTIGLDLIDHIFELDGEILGD